MALPPLVEAGSRWQLATVGASMRETEEGAAASFHRISVLFQQSQGINCWADARTLLSDELVAALRAQSWDYTCAGLQPSLETADVTADVLLAMCKRRENLELELECWPVKAVADNPLRKIWEWWQSSRNLFTPPVLDVWVHFSGRQRFQLTPVDGSPARLRIAEETQSTWEQFDHLWLFQSETRMADDGQRSVRFKVTDINGFTKPEMP
eukprot:CAMPEP_0114566258 /NCGR_PEP_ID=MMETSP0114-20121206/14784_1 /TAXON_ID=31324 /ORGANISM="Goniomonas sp, Strain m" /LENGTH=209 /DNA_ID=CAMNT_0001752633 /DNA_START=290 /DNA_END=916 /DNA_ORIENTATION=+